MISLLFPLLLTCQNPQVGLEVRIITDAGPLQTTLLGWQDGLPLVASDQSMASWWSVDLPHPAAEYPQAWNLALSDGSWLPGKPVEGAKVPTWQLAGLPEVDALAIDTLWLEAFGRSRLPHTEAERDLLWSRTSGGGLDRLRGYLVDWSADGIVFETAVRERLVKWEQVDALALLAEEVPAQEDAVWVQLVNGGVLSAHILGADDAVFHLELPWGTRWDLPFAAVHRLRQRRGVEEWSLQAWEVVEQPSAEALDWTPRSGKSVEGRPLRIGGAQVFAQGIGVLAKTVLSKSVSSAGVLFLSIGVDQEVKNFRSPQAVLFQVFLDAELLLQSERKQVGDVAQTLLVHVPHAGELQLVATPADVLPFGAHADWCDIVWKASQIPE